MILPVALMIPPVLTLPSVAVPTTLSNPLLRILLPMVPPGVIKKPFDRRMFKLPMMLPLAVTTPSVLIFAPRTLPPAVTTPSVLIFAPRTLPAAVTCPSVLIFAPRTLPAAVTCPSVLIFAPRTLPAAVTCPLVITLPIVALPETLAVTAYKPSYKFIAEAITLPPTDTTPAAITLPANDTVPVVRRLPASTLPVTLTCPLTETPLDWNTATFAVPAICTVALPPLPAMPITDTPLAI